MEKASDQLTNFCAKLSKKNEATHRSAVRNNTRNDISRQNSASRSSNDSASQQQDVISVTSRTSRFSRVNPSTPSYHATTRLNNARMSETTSPTLPTLPPLYLPPESTRHLRALIYASTPGNLITNLSQHASATQISITLSQTPPLTPLYHAPHPNISHNKNFLSEFPLTACYTPPSQEIILHTTLPDFMHTLSDELPLPQGALSDTPSSVLLKTGTVRVSNGLVLRDSGCYNPLMELPRSGTFDEIVGAWGIDDVSVTTGFLRLARFLYRRCNRRIRTDGSRAVRKEVVLLRFRDEFVTVRRGWIGVSGVRRWVCYLPLRGGTARFIPVDSRGRREVLDLLRGVAGGNRRSVDRGVDRGAVRSAARNGRGNGDFRTRRRRPSAVREVQSSNGGGDRVGAEEEIMVWKMREFNFGGLDDRDMGDVEEESAVEVQNVDETDASGMTEVRVVDVDIDTFGNTTITTTTTSSSSDSEGEEAMLETLCRQYLNQGYHESVEHELRR